MFSLALRWEAKESGKESQHEASALAFKNSGSFAKGSNKAESGRPQCTHCEALGHIVDKCYILHGYPPGYKFKNKGQQGGNPPFASNVVTTNSNSEESFSVSLEQNINSSLVFSILKITLILKHHKNLPLVFIK